MGPTCEVLVESDDDATLDAIDAILTELAERVERTRRGRVWSVWIAGRPIDVRVDVSPPRVTLAAGGKSSDDFDSLERLAAALAARLGGIASRPEK